MAIMKQGILGGLSGSIGNVTGSSWKGKAVLKSKPQSVANPQTAAQTAQRTKFGFVVAFAKEILASHIKPLWDRFASGQSGYNAFVSANIDLFLNPFPSAPQDFVLGTGKMAATPMTQAQGNNGSATVTINWADDSGDGFKLATDEAYVVAMNGTSLEIAGEAAQATRADQTASFDFPSAQNTGETLWFWLCFRRADGTVVSKTAYATAVVA